MKAWKFALPILLALPQLAAAQDKTPASAFAFIQSAIADGSWFGEVEVCDKNGYCKIVWNKISSVQTYGGSYCLIRITLPTDSAPYIVTNDINLTKNIQINDGGVIKIAFNGPVIWGGRDIVNNWLVEAPNWEVQRSVINAFQFLQKACKPASPW